MKTTKMASAAERESRIARALEQVSLVLIEEIKRINR